MDVLLLMVVETVVAAIAERRQVQEPCFQVDVGIGRHIDETIAGSEHRFADTIVDETTALQIDQGWTAKPLHQRAEAVVAVAAHRLHQHRHHERLHPRVAGVVAAAHHRHHRRHQHPRNQLQVHLLDPNHNAEDIADSTGQNSGCHQQQQLENRDILDHSTLARLDQNVEGQVADEATRMQTDHPDQMVVRNETADRIGETADLRLPVAAEVAVAMHQNLHFQRHMHRHEARNSGNASCVDQQQEFGEHSSA
jgi:hypothetical protein